MVTPFFSKRVSTLLIVAALPVFAVGCKRDEKFAEIGDKVVNPADVAVSDDGGHFFVLNADADRTYNEGSVLVLDQDGNKVSATGTPRGGRNLTVAGNDMLALFDWSDETRGAEARLFDISNPAEPALAARWDLPCSPINAVMRKGYPYFAITCAGGKLFVGELASDRTQSWIKLVRDFGQTRRALHLDPKRGLLFAFCTDLGSQDLSDEELQDSETWNDDGVMTAGSNEIPDALEHPRRVRRNLQRRQKYQFVVYNVGAEKEAKGGEAFPYRKTADPVVQRELHWLYFTLANFDGHPDSDVGFRNMDVKNYRTNIWAAEPDPFDDDSFYISQRGPGKSEYANSVVHVTITGDVVGTGEVAPPTADVMTFERVYGFLGELDKLHYPGDFEVVPYQGEPLLVVNHFRDLSASKRENIRFSIAARVVGDNFWFTEFADTDPRNSFFQVAANRSGRVVTGSFYGSAVILLEVTPSVGITELKRIE